MKELTISNQVMEYKMWCTWYNLKVSNAKSLHLFIDFLKGGELWKSEE